MMLLFTLIQSQIKSHNIICYCICNKKDIHIETILIQKQYIKNIIIYGILNKKNIQEIKSLLTFLNAMILLGRYKNQIYRLDLWIINQSYRENNKIKEEHILTQLSYQLLK